jgi:peptidoglycan/LPS O-acetylase OafA/YrhL
VKKQKEHYRELDGMRGTLACVVMLFHLGLNTVMERATHGVFRIGAWGLCVDFFFALSGFVLAQSMLAKSQGLGFYFARRIFRLAPTFLLTTAWVLAIAPMRWPAHVVAANLLMIQPFFGWPSLNFPGWSIPFELFFPAVWIPVVPWLSRRARPVIWFVTVLLVADACIAADLARQAEGSNGQAALRAGVGLALGAVLYVLYARAQPKSSAGASLACVAMALVIMAIAGRVPALAVLFPLTTAGAIWFGARAKGLFSTAPMQELGRGSYAIYLLHVPVLYTMQAIVGEQSARGLFSKLAIFVITLLLASIVHRCVEMPMMLGGRRLFGHVGVRA